MTQEIYTKSLISFFDTDDGSWKRYENEKGFLAFISPMDGVTYEPGNADIYIKDLPFYVDVKIVQMRFLDENAAPQFYFFLKYGSQYVQLKGQSDVIYEVNEESELNITLDTVFDYLKFFNLFTHNDDGDCFYVIEGQNSEILSEFSAYETSRYLRKFMGATVDDASEMGVYTLSTRVLCGEHLYDCDFDVTRDGFVEMKEDKLVGSI
ncbi:MAG: hypothetical protein COA45_11190 [Zetaproteobacteria bacterium]|nr:MAG: hypothetical protein COA45_11190 [Zetaproteobacteria bacterium]